MAWPGAAWRGAARPGMASYGVLPDQHRGDEGETLAASLVIRTRWEARGIVEHLKRVILTRLRERPDLRGVSEPELVAVANATLVEITNVASDDMTIADLESGETCFACGGFMRESDLAAVDCSDDVESFCANCIEIVRARQRRHFGDQGE